MEYINDKINTIILKEDSINNLDFAFHNYILNKDYKTANLLAYWINDFTKYHFYEENYNLKKQRVFRRGSIVKANLGFNIGNELRRSTILYCS